MIQRLKELRLEKSFSQKEFALKLNITQQTYSDYETGRTNPDISTLIKISDLLEVSIDYLLARSDDLGSITIYPKTDTLTALSIDEQKIIDALRKNAPIYSGEFITMYAELPAYMQETIFAELKGMHLGYKVSKKKTN